MVWQTFQQHKRRLSLKFRAQKMLSAGRERRQTLLNRLRSIYTASDAGSAPAILTTPVTHRYRSYYDLPSPPNSVGSTNSLLLDEPSLIHVPTPFSSPRTLSNPFQCSSSPQASYENTKSVSWFPFSATNPSIVVASSALMLDTSKVRRKKSAEFSRSIGGLVSSTSAASIPSPDVPQQPQQQHLLASHRKQQHLKNKMLSNDYKAGRMKSFFRHGILRHDQRVFKNRGIWLPPDGSKWNLGNLLHITDKYTADLDVDPSQSIIISASAQSTLPDARTWVQIHSLRLNGEQFDRDLFDSAQSLVCEQFAKKNVIADLDGVEHDNFTVDVVTDPISRQVLGAVEYVFMKKYLWIDAIAVREDVRRLGVGYTMLQRLKTIAQMRQKELLCFGLHDVCNWYIKYGFEHSSAFPELPWHIGRFLVWKPT